MNEEFIPVNVAADITGYTPGWVRNLIKRGIIRAIDEYGRKRVSLPDLTEYKAQVCVLGTAKHALRYQEAANAQPA